LNVRFALGRRTDAKSAHIAHITVTISMGKPAEASRRLRSRLGRGTPYQVAAVGFVPRLLSHLVSEVAHTCSPAELDPGDRVNGEASGRRSKPIRRLDAAGM